MSTSVAPLEAPAPAFRFAGAVRLATRQLMRNRLATLGLIVLVLFCIVAIVAPFISPYDPVKISLATKLRPPSFAHWLGTDHFGRDVLSRLMHGARVSLSVGCLVVS